MKLEKRKKILVLGGSIDQLPMINLCKDKGHEVIVLDFNPDAIGFPLGDKKIVASTKNAEQVLEIAKEEKVDAITSFITESGHKSILHTANHLDIPSYLSQKAVAATCNKIEMRKILEKEGLNDLPFCQPSSWEEVSTFADVHQFPLVIKTSQSAGQTGVYKVLEKNELKRIYVNFFSKLSKDEVILEKFTAGPEINIVYTVYKGKIQDLIISDRQTNQEAFGVAKRHRCPSIHFEGLKEKVWKKCQEINDCLEIENAVVYPQMIVNEDFEPTLIEIGVRVPGGHMKEVMEYHTGIDLLEYRHDISLGIIKPYEEYRTIEVFPYVFVSFLNSTPGALKVGKVHKTVGFEEVKKMRALKQMGYFITHKDLPEITPLKEGKDRFFYIITTGQTRRGAYDAFMNVFQGIDFLDENGESLVNKHFDFEQFYNKC